MPNRSIHSTAATRDAGGQARPRLTNRRALLGRAALGVGGATALSVGPSAAKANQVDELVGAWTVEITSTSAPYQGVQNISADGTLMLTFAPSGLPASGEPPRLYATGYGIWTRAGLRDYRFIFKSFSVTEQGHYAGVLTVNGQAHLADDLQAFGGSYTSIALDASGGLVANAGALKGTRMVLTMP
jgi:hypothetical protein